MHPYLHELRLSAVTDVSYYDMIELGCICICIRYSDYWWWKAVKRRRSVRIRWWKEFDEDSMYKRQNYIFNRLLNFVRDGCSISYGTEFKGNFASCSGHIHVYGHYSRGDSKETKEINEYMHWFFVLHLCNPLESPVSRQRWPSPGLKPWAKVRVVKGGPEHD